MSLLLYFLLSPIGSRKNATFCSPKQTEMYEIKWYFRYFEWLKTTVSRHTNGLRTIQLLICYSFLCVYLSGRPSVHYSYISKMPPKQVYFETKAHRKCSPQKFRCVFRRPWGPTSVLFSFSLPKRICYSTGQQCHSYSQCTLLVSCTRKLQKR